MSLSAGVRIGVFQIASKLGEGEMGEVYVARDTRLDRDVALKVLPELFTSDPERLARFEREAKVLASLNHPNIAQVYGFEGPSTSSGRTAIAMELVQGETLEEIIRAAETGLPLHRALPIMRQIAIALEAAHDQGIIHRDLKPANVNAFNPKTMEASATPVPVLDGVGVKSSGAANYDISSDGALVFASGSGLSAMRTIAWVSRTGVETPISAEPRNYYYARIAPDGTRLTLDTRDQEQDIWIWDVRREDLTRLTDKPGSEQYGLWTAGSQRVVFSSDSSGKNEIYQIRPDGTGQVEQLTDTTKEKLAPFPNAVTPDGKQVVFRASSGVTKNDLWISSASGDRSVKVLLSSEHDERNATFSPDGKWIAYESDQSGRFEVYVRPFPDVDSGRFPVSTAGGEEPVWSPTGKEIFYVAGGNMMAVPVSTAGGFVAQKPIVLFNTTPYFFGGQGRNYDVTRDGQRFAMIKSPTDVTARIAPINIVLNWAEELRAKLK